MKLEDVAREVGVPYQEGDVIIDTDGGVLVCTGSARAPCNSKWLPPEIRLDGGRATITNKRR